MLSTETIQQEVDLVFADLLQFSKDILAIPSYTFQEGNAITRAMAEMQALGFDQVYMDKTGNAIGIIGDGDTTILFDSHIDTVLEGERATWTVDPFGGVCKDGKLYGLGASDMKCGGTTAIYAAALMKKLQLHQGKRIVVAFSTMEEDLDGLAMEHMLENNDFRPDYVVIPEPTDLRLCRGHGGRVMYKVTIPGISAHGSRPEDGVNAVYEMQEMITRVGKWSQQLLDANRAKGSVALTKIESEAASLNAVPYGCTIYLDRRTTATQTEAELNEELDALVSGTKATWETMVIEADTWNGEAVAMRCYRPAFDLAPDHPLVVASHKAYTQLEGQPLGEFRFKGTTNAVSSAGLMGIPSIVFGPGCEDMCHTVDEYCIVENIKKACAFYVNLVAHL